MGYLSCNTESAIATCDSYNFKNITKTRKNHSPKKEPIKEFSYSDLHSATNAFSEANLLGKGSHGYVYKAYLHQNKLTAAVKTTKLRDFRNNSPAENEIEILSRVHHPRLVNLLGYAIDSNHNKLLVVEFMPNGSLYELLHCHSTPPGWSRRVRFALQIASGTNFLHTSNPPVIHRDIKSSNILIDSNFNARLGDFGLSLRGHVEDVIVKGTPPAGTLGYLDPGYLNPGDLSAKSDVFSFGILLLELISGRNAIDVNYSPPSVVDWAVPLIKSGDYSDLSDPRIGSPEDDWVLRQLAAAAARCVRKTAAKRPAMEEVVGWLKMVYKRMSSPVWGKIGRRVGRVRESSRVVKYEPLDDDSTEVVKVSRIGSRRNRKVSNVMSVELGNRNEEIKPVIRSKSIGSFSEIESEPLDLSNNNLMVKRKGGLAVKMPTVRLSKSRSMGMIQSSTRLMMNKNNNSSNGVVVKFVKKPNGKELEESKLLVGVGKEPQREE